MFVLTVALSLSFKLAARESESTPELEPAGDLICVLLDLKLRVQLIMFNFKLILNKIYFVCN